jgi:hypothetical protein
MTSPLHHRSIDQGSKKPSAAYVLFLVATGGTVRRIRTWWTPAALRRAPAAFRRSRAPSTHAGAEEEQLHSRRAIDCITFLREGEEEGASNPKRRGEQQLQETQRNAVNERKSNGRGERRWNGLVSWAAAPGPLFIHGLQGEGRPHHLRPLLK